MLGLPQPGSMVNLSPAYEPVMIKGMTLHKDNPFLFDFIIDTGNAKLRSQNSIKNEGDRLIRYFLACLTIPEKDLWVNLSPYEKDRMVPQSLGQTALGRDLLAQDYILKQLTASMIYPEKNLGKVFWDRVYAKAQEMYGTSQIPVNTFNKVWIIADKATVYEHGQTVFVLDGHLKVMLEEDYLALTKHQLPTRGHVPRKAGYVSPSTLRATASVRHEDPSELGLSAKASQGNHLIASQIIRQIILPELEHEVNIGKNFSVLRQIFNSLILASWYKKNLKKALLNQVYADKGTVKGNIVGGSKQTREKIYEQYIKAYKKGVFDYIKEDTQPNGQVIPKKYFSGGFVSQIQIDDRKASTPETRAMISNVFAKAVALFLLSVFLSSSSVQAQAAVQANNGIRTAQQFQVNSDAALIAKNPYDDIKVLFKRPFEGHYISVQITIGDIVIEKEGFWPQPPPLDILAAEIVRRTKKALGSLEAKGLAHNQLKRFIEKKVSVNVDEAMKIVTGKKGPQVEFSGLWFKWFRRVDTKEVMNFIVALRSNIELKKSTIQAGHNTAHGSTNFMGRYENGWRIIEGLYAEGLNRWGFHGGIDYNGELDWFFPKENLDSIISWLKDKEVEIAQITSPGAAMLSSTKKDRIIYTSLALSGLSGALMGAWLLPHSRLDLMRHLWNFDPSVWKLFALEVGSGFVMKYSIPKAVDAWMDDSSDRAALAPGGIDLNTTNGLQWKDSKEGPGVEMSLDPAMIARIRRDGVASLSPVIFKIKRLLSIWPLIGFQVSAVK